MLHFLLNQLISANMRWNDIKIHRPTFAAARNTEQTQSNLLAEILHENRNTVIGRSFDFSSISSFEEYRRKVPLQNYEQLAPFIDRQIGGEQALTAAPPLYYARTSGTTGRYKDIPQTHHGLQQVKPHKNIWRFPFGATQTS